MWNHLTFYIPPRAVHAEIEISTTSNLRAQVQILSGEKLLETVLNRSFITAIIIAFLVLSAAMGLGLWFVQRRVILLFYASYMLSWSLLVAGISNILVVYDSSWLPKNDMLVSVAAIAATITGTLFYWKLLKEFVRSFWGHWALFGLSLVAVLALAVCLFVDERQGLSLNIQILLLGSFVSIVGTWFWKGKDHISSFLVARLRWPFVSLMAFVLITAVSGLGQGQSFSLTYMHGVPFYDDFCIKTINNGYIFYPCYGLHL